MANVDSTALRRFLDPVREAAEARSEAVAAWGAFKECGLVNAHIVKKRRKAADALVNTQRAYDEAVGELIGGLDQLIKNAERCDNDAIMVLHHVQKP